MEAIRQYILSVLCGALIVGILLDLSEKSGFRKQLQLVCGIFFACILTRPLLYQSVPGFAGLTGSFLPQAEAAAAQGETLRIRSLAAVIRQETEAYILKEAEAIGVEVTVQVELDTADPPAPAAVTVQGFFDAAGETQLSERIAEELGIPKEHQTWIRHSPLSSDNS